MCRSAAKRPSAEKFLSCKTNMKAMDSNHMETEKCLELFSDQTIFAL
jgi:hypothetical protein